MRRAAIALLVLGLAACGQPQSPKADGASAPAPAAFTAEQNAAAIAALSAPLNTANYENGRRVFAQCRSCHLVQAGAGNRIGPNLHGIIGAKSGGHSEGFRYSPAMKSADLTWDAETLDRYLEDPRAALPGTQMAFAGLRKPDDRRDVIAYIAVESQR